MLLCYITDRRAFGEDEDHRRRALLRRVVEAAAAGVDYIQLREKDLSTRDLEALAKDVISVVRSNSQRTRLLINERTDVALASGADGVHLPGKSLPASEVRSVWMRRADRAPVIGVSAHSVDEVRYAEAHGADFALLGPIFEKPNTGLCGLGVDQLSIARQGAQVPENTEAAPQHSFAVLALGGVNLQNAAQCLRSGASGLAGIRLFQEGDVNATICALRGMQA